MGKTKPFVLNSWEVMPFTSDGQYLSRMMLDDSFVGQETVQLNEGTFAPLATMELGAHDDHEIYYIVKGSGTLQLDDEMFDIRQGTTVFIPAGCMHKVTNTSPTDTLVLITVWRNRLENHMLQARQAAWGTLLRRVDANGNEVK